MSVYIWALLIGIVAGLRSMTAPAVVSWAARAGWLPVAGTPLGFLGTAAAPWIISVFAVGELIVDKLPNTPSRKAPIGFATRLVTGAMSGGAIGSTDGNLIAGAIMGALGAVIGTLGGYEFRMRLVRASGLKDLPIALLEDTIAIILAIAVVTRFA